MPEHYRHFFRKYLKFSIVWLIFAGLAGILYQESSKKAPFSADLPPGMHWESVVHLSLLHGHAFMMGGLLPMVVVWMLYVAHQLSGNAVSPKTLGWTSGLYLPATSIAILLILYKGYHYLLFVRFGQRDFAHIAESFFFGSEVARAIVYGVTHTALFVSLSALLIAIWKTLGKPKSPVSNP